MRFTPTILVASCAALSAAAPTMLAEDDVVLYGNGRMQKMKRSELAEIEAIMNSGITPPRPNELEESLYTVLGNATQNTTSALTKRGDDSIVIPNEPIRFLGWDMLVSRVGGGANAPSGNTITISSGVSTSNTIKVGSSTTASLIKGFLETTLSIDYTHTWTTTHSEGFTFTVPQGKYGALVSNAWTNRQSGNIWRGDIGGEGSLTYYQADSFESRNYGDFEWVSGVIQPCVKDTFPLTRCLGEGEL